MQSRPKLQSSEFPCEVIGNDEMSAFKEVMDGINAQRHCMRISDARWQHMKRRARASKRPYAEALKSELSSYSRVILARLTDLKII